MKSNIRKLRNEKQISQTTLANVIGKTQQTVSHMEQDRDRISIESLITLSEYFGVSTDCILGIEEKKDIFPEKIGIFNPDAYEAMGKEGLSLGSIVKSKDSKLLYEFILSLLLYSLEEQA